MNIRSLGYPSSAPPNRNPSLQKLRETKSCTKISPCSRKKSPLAASRRKGEQKSRPPLPQQQAVWRPARRPPPSTARRERQSRDHGQGPSPISNSPSVSRKASSALNINIITPNSPAAPEYELLGCKNFSAITILNNESQQHLSLFSLDSASSKVILQLPIIEFSPACPLQRGMLFLTFSASALVCAFLRMRS